MAPPVSPRKQAERLGRTRPVLLPEVHTGSARIEQLATPRYRLTTSTTKADGPGADGSAANRFGGVGSRTTLELDYAMAGSQKRWEALPRVESAAPSPYGTAHSTTTNPRDLFVLSARGGISAAAADAAPLGNSTPRRSGTVSTTMPATAGNAGGVFGASDRGFPTTEELLQQAQRLTHARPHTRTQGTGAHAANGIAGIVLASSADPFDVDAALGGRSQQREALQVARVPAPPVLERAAAGSSSARRPHPPPPRGAPSEGGAGEGEGAQQMSPSGWRTLAVSGLDPRCGVTARSQFHQAPDYWQLPRATRHGANPYPLHFDLTQPRPEAAGLYCPPAAQFDANTRGMNVASAVLTAEKLHKRAVHQANANRLGWREAEVVAHAEQDLAHKQAQQWARALGKRKTREAYEARVGAGR